MAGAARSSRPWAMSISASQKSRLKVGEKVQVTLPDDSTIAGAITEIGAVATSTSSTSSATGGQGSQSSSSSSDATITVQVGLGDRTDVGLDQAPVTVGITSDSRTGVLAVPVTALLAVSGGGYAVEKVAADGRHSYVSVQPGLFADSMVEVKGALAQGDRVVVPTGS